MAQSSFYGVVTNVFDLRFWEDQAIISFSVVEKGVGWDRNSREDLVVDKAFWSCEMWVPGVDAESRMPGVGDQVWVEGDFGQSKPKQGEKIGHTRFSIRRMEVVKAKQRPPRQQQRPRNDDPWGAATNDPPF